jgi:hypothetical protein
MCLLHMAPFTTQQHPQPSIAKPSANPGQLPQSGADRRIVWLRRPVPDRTPVHRKHGTRPTLAHPMPGTEVRHRFSPRGGRQNFFVAMSFSMALSSIASASSRFSFAFSSSRTFSRHASDTSMPPYLDFHL